MISLKHSLTICFLVAATAIYSQSQKEVIYIRIQESLNWNSSASSFMSISYEGGENEMVDLLTIKNAGKNADRNGKVIRKRLNDFINQGYEILSTSTGSGDAVSTTVIILSRDEGEID